jgi:hypothetical protein
MIQFDAGLGDSGATLTMISALSRCGCDPWIEARPLVGLAKSGCCGSVKSPWCKMPSAWCTLSDLSLLLEEAK